MSNNKSALERALPIVAAAYGEQFGVNVVLSGTDAYTDGKSIVIPLLSAMSEMREILFGYLAHEAAHVRDSNFEVISQCKNSLEKTFTNLLEDIRIEKLIQDVFPGTQFTLDAMWSYVVEQGMSPPSLPHQNEASQLCQYLLHRLRSEVLKRPASLPLVNVSKRVLEKTFPIGFFIRLDGLLVKYLDSLTCTQDCLVLARAIIKAIKEAEDEERKRQDRSDSENTKDASVGNVAEKSTQSSSRQSGTSSDSEVGGSSTSTDNSSQNGSVSGSSNSNLPSLADRLLNETDLPNDAISQLKERLTEQARNDNGGENIIINTSSAGRDVRNSGETGRLETGILASSVIRSRLLGLLQARSREKQWLHTRGKRVDGKRLTRVASGNSRVFIQRDEQRQPETAVHVLLDSSGSMKSMQNIANQAAVSLALAVSTIPKCDIAVSMFPGVDGAVSPVIYRGQPVRPSLGRFAVCSSGGTPLAEAMLYAARELAQSRRQRKVLIIVTDGAPENGSSVKYLNCLISKHVDIYAIGIGSKAVSQYFKNWSVINDVNQLQAALFSIAGQFLNIN